MSTCYSSDTVSAATPETACAGSVRSASAIHIIGLNPSSNQSLLYFLESSLNARCSCQLHSSRGALIDRSTGPDIVLLIDCLAWDSAVIGRQIDRCTTTDAAKIVLFNVDARYRLKDTLGRDGTWGVFYQDDSKSIFLNGMRAILNGQRWMSPLPESTSAADSRRTTGCPHEMLQSLSCREKEILGLIATGMSNTQIATGLNISLHTVKTHIYNIYKKIDVPNRLQAALWATAHYAEGPQSGETGRV